MDYKLSLLAVNQLDIGVQVDNNTTEMIEIKQRLSLVEDKIKDDGKLKLYAIYTSKKEPNINEMATEIGVSIRTIKYWLKELRKLGVIT